MSFRAFKIFLSGVLLPLEAGWCSHLVASVKHTWRKKLLATYRCDRWYYQRHNKHKKHIISITEIAWSCFFVENMFGQCACWQELVSYMFLLSASIFFSMMSLHSEKSNRCANVLCGDMFYVQTVVFLFSQRASRRCEKGRRLLASFRGKGYWANVAAKWRHVTTWGCSTTYKLCVLCWRYIRYHYDT